MRIVSALHDLTLALLVGGIAGAALCAVVLFDRAPTREIAGQVGNAIFQALAPAVLALSFVLLLTRYLLLRLEPASRARSAALMMAAAIAVLAAALALWLTPRMGAIWEAAPRAWDGSGLAGEDRRRFMTLHGIGNLAYLLILLMGAALILLRRPDPRSS